MMTDDDEDEDDGCLWVFTGSVEPTQTGIVNPKPYFSDITNI